MSDLDRLSAMARMVEEVGTAKLREAAALRDAVKAQIAALEASRAQDAPKDAGEARVNYAYDQWAARRRAQLNLHLARHEASCRALMDEARRAFGRARVIEKLALQQAEKRKPRA